MMDPRDEGAQLPEKQTWTESVIESVSDSAERERLIREYDYDELVQACLSLGTLVLSIKKDRAEAKQRAQQLTDELAGARRDGERYRFLRSSNWTQGGKTLVVVRAESCVVGTNTFTEERLNFAIDAALKKGGG